MSNEKHENLMLQFIDSFMKPEFYMGLDIEESLMHEGLDIEHDSVYYRLSASGFIDCSSWHGPFNDVSAAIDDCFDTYCD